MCIIAMLTTFIMPQEPWAPYMYMLLTTAWELSNSCTEQQLAQTSYHTLLNIPTPAMNTNTPDSQTIIT